MNEIQDKLYDLLDKINSLDQDGDTDLELLYDVRSKVRLYISKFFNERLEFEELIGDVDSNPSSHQEFKSSIFKLRSIITTLLEDINLSTSDLRIQTEEEKQEILSQVRKEAELERERLKHEGIEIQKMKDQLFGEQQRLLDEEEKYNLFKQKLEVANNELDFYSESRKNKNISLFWGLLTTVLILILFGFLQFQINDDDSFSKIALNIKSKLEKDFINSHDIINKTIYIAITKYIITKLLFYSMLIYCIIFCVKNYNAQMHNSIINLHKANAFKSTLSLLDTAKSDDGNDKLLVQATQAIFSHQNTGYNGQGSEPSSPNLVTNVFDSVSKKI